MKRILVTALLAIATVGIASADYETDKQYDLLYSDRGTGQMDVTRLPPTAAGKQESEQMKMQPHYGGMQDHPRERPSGI